MILANAMLQYQSLMDCAEVRTIAALCRCSQMLVLSVLDEPVMTTVMKHQWLIHWTMSAT